MEKGPLYIEQHLHITKDPKGHHRYASIESDELTWIEVTAIRLIQFFVSMNAFRKATSVMILYDPLTSLEYYMSDKIPMGFRANLYENCLFGRDLQEQISVFFDPSASRLADGVDIWQFCAFLREDARKQKIFAQVVDRLLLDTKILKSHLSKMDESDPAWHPVVGFSHVLIYLIDLFQNVERNPKWEEYRIFFTKVVKDWGSKRQAYKYLYSDKDICSGNYLDTYADDLRESNSLSKRSFEWPFRNFISVKRLAKRYAINRRGRRFVHRHHRKTITGRGVSISVGKETYNLLYNEEISVLYKRLESYMGITRRKVL